MSLAAQIAAELGQGKELRNRDGWVTCCPGHGDEKPSLSIKDNGNNPLTPERQAGPGPVAGKQIKSTGKFKCKSCMEWSYPYLTKGKGPHAGAFRCNECDSFIKWVSKKQITDLTEVF